MTRNQIINFIGIINRPRYFTLLSFIAFYNCNYTNQMKSKYIYVGRGLLHIYLRNRVL